MERMYKTVYYVLIFFLIQQTCLSDTVSKQNNDSYSNSKIVRYPCECCKRIAKKNAAAVEMRSLCLKSCAGTGTILFEASCTEKCEMTTEKNDNEYKCCELCKDNGFAYRHREFLDCISTCSSKLQYYPKQLQACTNMGIADIFFRDIQDDGMDKERIIHSNSCCNKCNEKHTAESQASYNCCNNCKKSY